MKLHTIPVALAVALTITSCDKNGKEAGEGDKPVTNATPSVSKHEELAGEIMNSMADFADAVSNVVDLESANEAATKIGTIGDRFSKIADQLKPLEPPAKAIKEAINEKMEARDAEMQKVMGEELQKTMQALSPEAQQVLQKAFEEFFEKMDSAGKEFERHFSAEEEAGS